ncbi:(Fe-S)-binding protein [Mesorhizobium sp. CAU 1732]|uniref:(Fe-S)-binding protein n=1 Tax=Mesorhizobium sp. CAU 1732 TaxID=3140358 RepID=UPI0032608774
MTNSAPHINDTRPRVGLFVTCLVDLFRPSVGFAAVKLIEDAGCVVEVPVAQSCCGQPAERAGDLDDLRAIAETTIRAFEEFDYVVAPSGTCASVLKTQYAPLFSGNSMWEARAQAFSAKVHELVSFLVDVLGISAVEANVSGSVTYHDGCAGLTQLGVQTQPRLLLASVKGLRLKEMARADACCGLAGVSCAQAASRTAASEKTAQIREAGAGTLLSGDLGCLISIAGRLKREGSAIEVRHVAEVLAGMNDTPPIGGPSTRRDAKRA